MSHQDAWGRSKPPPPPCTLLYPTAYGLHYSAPFAISDSSSKAAPHWASCKNPGWMWPEHETEWQGFPYPGGDSTFPPFCTQSPSFAPLPLEKARQGKRGVAKSSLLVSSKPIRTTGLPCWRRGVNALSEETTCRQEHLQGFQLVGQQPERRQHRLGVEHMLCTLKVSGSKSGSTCKRERK